MTPELEDYIEKHISPEPDYLSKIDRLTNLYHINGRMCSGHIQGRLLKMLASMINPQRVIELGTFTGYSALCLAEGMADDATLDTIEVDEELEEEILKNFASSPYSKKISLHIGNALEIMNRWEPGYFDLALIDADKRQYPQYFQKLLELVKPGGYIIADNTLWDGHVTETGKHSSQTEGIIEFNNLVAQTPGIDVSIIPMRDGLTLIRKHCQPLSE